MARNRAFALVAAFAAWISLISLIFWTAPAAARVVEVEWWHAMPGQLGREVEKLAAEFNESQPGYRIVARYKGLYTETMTGALFALRSGQHPAIVQAAEVATATMMAATNSVYPLFQLMRDEAAPLDPAVYFPAISGYYTDQGGNMLSFPFNSSTPILYYNKDQFRFAGLDVENPPATWPQIESAVRKLRGAGIPCGITAAWPSWIHVENFSAFHDLPIATGQNGLAGGATRLTINSQAIVNYIAMLSDWQKTKLFDYAGRTLQAEAKFHSSECGLLISSSAARADILAHASFEVGYGMLPYWPDIPGAPQNSIIGGGSLWVLKGRPDAEYRGVARFLAFLSRADIQARWHQATGYLPITREAYELSRAQGFYSRHPGADIPIRQLALKPPTAHSWGLRLGSFVVIREIIEEELEHAFFGRKSARAALEAATQRGNEVLRQFEKSNP